MKINSGFCKWVVSSVFPMALLSLQASFSVGQDDLSKSPSAEDLQRPFPPVDVSLTDPSLPSEVGEQTVIPPQAPYGRQQQFQIQSSPAYGQPVYSRNWFRRPHRRTPHFTKLPPAAIPPAGENLNTFWAIQVSNGEAARMVLYDFDFVPGQANLTPRGTRQLAKFADLLQQTPHPLIIQPSSEYPGLDEIRRNQVLCVLATMNLYIAEDRLIVRTPSSRGLDGIDAERIHAGLMGTSGGSAGGQNGQNGQTPVSTPFALPGQ